MVHERTQPAHILLVEDNEADATRTRNALASGPNPVVVHTLDTTEDAWLFLRGEGRFADAPVPQFVLLAHTLPGLDGIGLVERIKSDNRLKRIPVILLTQSDLARDKLIAYRHLANSYVVKPRDPEMFGEIVRRIERFWLDLAVLPDGSTGSGLG